MDLLTTRERFPDQEVCVEYLGKILAEVVKL